MIPRPRWSPSRALWLSLAGSVLLLVCVLWMVRHRNDSDVLPAPVVRAIEAEKAARPSIDSAVAQSRYEADIAKADRIAAEAEASRLRRAAEIQGRRADSLEQEARHALTARDSAVMWHLAYAARTTERDTLRVTIDTLALSLARAEAESRALRRGLDAADAGRHRADSVLDATVAAARAANCRVPLTFGLVHCLTRTQSAVAGGLVVITSKVVYDAARDGRITIPLVRRRTQ